MSPSVGERFIGYEHRVSEDRIGSLRMPGLQFYLAGEADAGRPVLIK